MINLLPQTANKSNFISQLCLAALFVIFSSGKSLACDTSPVITASNVQNVGGGFYTFDLQVCVGVNGSQDGFNLTMGCGLNITATNQPTINVGGNVASASITGGVLTYTFPGYPGTWFAANDGIAGPCFNMTLTVNGNPENCSVTTTGINDGCLIIQTSWTTTVPGPCLYNYSMVAPGSQSGNTSGGGNTCSMRASQDNIIQVQIPCTDTWTFSLCGGSSWDTYLYLGTSCCGGTITQNDDACGLQSQLSAALTAGTYYVTVEAYSSSTTGAYTLNVTSANPCSFLPVELTNFNGEYIESRNLNLLSWETATEESSDYFDIERSDEGYYFDKVGRVQGAGSSQEAVSYYFEDYYNSPSDIVYYRLKQVDFNGQSEYSQVITIKKKSVSFALGKVYPNPAHNELFIELNEVDKMDDINVEIYTSDLRLLRSYVFNPIETSGKSKLEIEDLESGVYSVVIRNSYSSETHKLIVVK